MFKTFMKAIMAVMLIGIIGAIAFGDQTIFSIVENWSPMWATYPP